MARERKANSFLPKPLYKGGPKAMGAFIASHLKYPEQAIENKIEGTVVVRIAINYKGKVTGSKVKSGIGHGCDEEAKRIVQLLSFEVHNSIRRGKILFHKTINIHFRLPKKDTIKKTEKSNSTHLTYHIVKKEKTNSTSYNYTITI